MSDPNNHAFLEKIRVLELELAYERTCAQYYELMTELLLEGGSLDDPRLHKLGKMVRSTSKEWEVNGGRPGDRGEVSDE